MYRSKMLDTRYECYNRLQIVKIFLLIYGFKISQDSFRTFQEISSKKLSTFESPIHNRIPDLHPELFLSFILHSGSRILYLFLSFPVF